MVWAGVCPVPRPSPPPPALGNIWEAELPDHLWGPVPLSTGRGQEEPHNTLGNLRTPRATLGPQCALESHSPPPGAAELRWRPCAQARISLTELPFP